jgi:hypothetical protein
VMAGTGADGKNAADLQTFSHHASPNTRLKIVSTCLK